MSVADRVGKASATLLQEFTGRKLRPSCISRGEAGRRRSSGWPLFRGPSDRTVLQTHLRCFMSLLFDPLCPRGTWVCACWPPPLRTCCRISYESDERYVRPLGPRWVCAGQTLLDLWRPPLLLSPPGCRPSTTSAMVRSFMRKVFLFPSQSIAPIWCA